MKHRSTELHHVESARDGEFRSKNFAFVKSLQRIFCNDKASFRQVRAFRITESTKAAFLRHNTTIVVFRD